MPRKKTIKNIRIMEENEIAQKAHSAPIVPAEVKVTKPAEAIPPEPENPYYSKTLWHGIKEVWQCRTCGTFRENEDAAIVHVVIHVPRLEQSALLDKLMKEYKHD